MIAAFQHGTAEIDLMVFQRSPELDECRVDAAKDIHPEQLARRLCACAGSSDGLLQISWHPQRSCFVSVGDSGKIYVWAQVYRENWSAFAPDFTELTENQVCCSSILQLHKRHPPKPVQHWMQHL